MDKTGGLLLLSMRIDTVNATVASGAEQISGVGSHSLLMLLDLDYNNQTIRQQHQRRRHVKSSRDDIDALLLLKAQATASTARSSSSLAGAVMQASEGGRKV